MLLELEKSMIILPAPNPSHLEQNPGSWNHIFILVFLDNPISIASTLEEITRNQYSVAKHLFAAITFFVKLDLSFKVCSLYFAGESYAGIPAIGYHVLKKNPYLPVSKRLDLAGFAMGNGLTDTVIQVATHAMNAYYSGLINERQKIELEKAQSQWDAVKLTKMGNWRAATNAKGLGYVAKHDRIGNFE